MRTLVLLVGLSFLGVGCDDGSPSSSPDLAMAGPDLAYASSCGFPGDQPINATGVGQFCEELLNCKAPAGNTAWKAVLCSTLGDPTAHFCTFQCDPTTAGECGAGAVCVCAGVGCGCTPNKCAPVDGGP